MDKKTQPMSPAVQLKQAVDLAKAGQSLEACDRLRQIVALQPVNSTAWLWLSAVAPDRNEAETALAQVRKINPTHHSLPCAERWLAKRFPSQPVAEETPDARSSALSEELSFPEGSKPASSVLKFFLLGFVVFLLVIGGVVLFLGMTGEVQATVGDNGSDRQTTLKENRLLYASLAQAWSQKDWEGAIAALQALDQNQVDPAFVRNHLAQAYLQHGVALRRKGFVAEALTQFEQALAVAPQDLRAQQEATLAKSYVSGKRHYQAGRWSEVVAALETIYRIDPNYTHVKDMLFSAYYNRGLALRAAEALAPARESFQAALALRPDLAEPRAQLAEIAFAAAPETPPSRPIPSVPLKDRMIVVGVAEQRMHVYEGDKKVFDFIVSTGEPGRDTAIGDFEIQNKIDVAYASTWNLDMPYWLGIYWSGPLQNGIHALPTVKHTGYTLWDGYLGQRVSYGCVILGEEDAATLYEWAEIGAKVKIAPSLANWKLSNEIGELGD